MLETFSRRCVKRSIDLRHNTIQHIAEYLFHLSKTGKIKMRTIEVPSCEHIISLIKRLGSELQSLFVKLYSELLC